MRTFNHLTKTKRIKLEALLKTNTSKKDIASYLGVHISTIYREIKRGTYDHLNENTMVFEKNYCWDIAEEKYRLQLKAKGRDLKITNDHKFIKYIEKRIIEDKLSPLAVLGEIKKKGLNFNTTICVNTLYNYIEKKVFSKLTIHHLPIKGKIKNKKRCITINQKQKGTSIEKRPIEINKRNTFGHWKMDCVCGSTRATLLVLTERLTRKEIIMPMTSQKSENVIHCLNIIEHQYGKSFKKIFKTITVDNGKEFADFIKLEKSKYENGKRTSVYYCHPYCSSERGSNERLNREIRRLIPKGCDLSKFSYEEIQHIENWVNEYPRQILDFATSKDKFNEQLKLIKY